MTHTGIIHGVNADTLFGLNVIDSPTPIVAANYLVPPPSGTLIGYVVSSSYAKTASYAANSSGGGTTLSTVSTYQITSSFAISASWGPGLISSLYASSSLSA